MKIYLASNFILMRYVKLELRFRKHLEQKYGYCGRLFSFFFTKEITKVITLLKDEHNIELNNEEVKILNEIIEARKINEL